MAKKHNIDRSEAVARLDEMSKNIAKVTAGMENKRGTMRVTLLIFFIGTIVFVVVSAASYLTKPDWDLMIWGNLVVFFFIIVTGNYSLRHEKNKYKNLYDGGRKLLSEMIKIIDWTVFRKRQLYRTNELSAINDINMFLTESQQTLSPVKDGWNYNELSVLGINLILTVSMTIQLIVHKQYLADMLRFAMELVGIEK